MSTSWLTAGKAKDIAGTKTIKYGAFLDTYVGTAVDVRVDGPFGTHDGKLSAC